MHACASLNLPPRSSYPSVTLPFSLTLLAAFSLLLSLSLLSCSLLKEIHTNFIDAVKEGRGERLKPEAAARMHHEHTSWVARGCGGWMAKPSKRTVRKLAKSGTGLFDGSVYSGEVGLELGLVDGVGEMRTELQKRFGRFVRLETMEEERLDYSRLLRWLF